MDEYFCPNCGAILNDQLGFDPDAGTWTVRKAHVSACKRM